MKRLTLTLVLVWTAAAAGCAATVPAPPFDRAEVAASVDPASACETACKPRRNESVVGCHGASLEPALVAHREALGDRNVRHQGLACLYRRQQ
jgi:hypothetical protein